MRIREDTGKHSVYRQKKDSGNTGPGIAPIILIIIILLAILLMLPGQGAATSVDRISSLAGKANMYRGDPGMNRVRATAKSRWTA